MKSILYKTVVLIIFPLAFFACKKERSIIKCENRTDYEMKKLTGERADLNIGILLDLSDRINPKKYPNSTIDYYKRDLEYIKSVAQKLEIHIRNKRSSKIKDRIQLFIDPEPSDKNLNEKLKELKFSFTKDNASKCAILETSKLYDSICTQIYEKAILDNNYIGSDIWSFFKNKIKDYCIEKEMRNILVIITDGYIYHENTLIKESNQRSYLTPQVIRRLKLSTENWKSKFKNQNLGFIPATNNLENLEILVLGVNPSKGNSYENDVINAFWEKWLLDMGVTNFAIKNADLPSHMDGIIGKFILEN